MKKKNKTPLGVFGLILLIFGIIFTISLSVKGEEYTYGLPITAFLVIMGIILIAWAFND